MTNTEKVALIGKLIADFWEYNSDETITASSDVIVAVINSVVEFESAEES